MFILQQGGHMYYIACHHEIIALYRCMIVQYPTKSHLKGLFCHKTIRGGRYTSYKCKTSSYMYNEASALVRKLVLPVINIKKSTFSMKHPGTELLSLLPYIGDQAYRI